MTPLFSGEVFSAVGKSICVADSTATDAVTIKMISRTRKISVSGVMLISQNIPPWPRGALMANDGSPGDGRVDQAGRADMDSRIDAFDFLGKIVIENDRDNRDDQP